MNGSKKEEGTRSNLHHLNPLHFSDSWLLELEEQKAPLQHQNTASLAGTHYQLLHGHGPCCHCPPPLLPVPRETKTATRWRQQPQKSSFKCPPGRISTPCSSQLFSHAMRLLSFRFSEHSCTTNLCLLKCNLSKRKRKMMPKDVSNN